MPLSGPPLPAPVDGAQILDVGMARDPAATALLSLETSWTWQELADDSSRLAGNLLSLGLAPGDRVATLMPNRCALIVFYLACIRAGLTVCPLNYRATPMEIDRALEACGAALLFAHRERAADLSASTQVGQLPYGVVGYGQGSLSGLRFEQIIDTTPKIETLPEADPARPAFVFFTACGSGRLRGVVHSPQSVGWGMASVVAGYGCTAEDTFLTASSLGHHGGIMHALGCLSAGARVAVARNVDADELLPLLRGERPTLAWMMPSALFRLVRDHEATAKDFASIRLLACGGDRAPLQMERDFETLTGLTLRETYGMSEFSCATVNLPGRQNRPGSIGTLMPGFRAEIRDEAGQALPAGREGRLWIKSPTMMQGYWQDPEATAAVLQDGWLDTGDRMLADAEGYLWFAGRRRQVVVHDDSTIAPQVVEGALIEHPSVARAGVVGVHDLLHGESVRAFVILEGAGETPTEQELIAFARARLGYRAPEQIVFLRDLPLDASGTTDRALLKQIAEAGIHGAPAA